MFTAIGLMLANRQTHDLLSDLKRNSQEKLITTTTFIID